MKHAPNRPLGPLYRVLARPALFHAIRTPCPDTLTVPAHPPPKRVSSLEKWPHSDGPCAFFALALNGAFLISADLSPVLSARACLISISSRAFNSHRPFRYLKSGKRAAPVLLVWCPKFRNLDTQISKFSPNLKRIQ